jgi:hypothetical protein
MSLQEIRNRKDLRLGEIAKKVQDRNGWASGDIDVFGVLEIEKRVKQGITETDYEQLCEKFWPKLKETKEVEE